MSSKRTKKKKGNLIFWRVKGYLFKCLFVYLLNSFWCSAKKGTSWQASSIDISNRYNQFTHDVWLIDWSQRFFFFLFNTSEERERKIEWKKKRDKFIKIVISDYYLFIYKWSPWSLYDLVMFKSCQIWWISQYFLSFRHCFSFSFFSFSFSFTYSIFHCLSKKFYINLSKLSVTISYLSYKYFNQYNNPYSIYI